MTDEERKELEAARYILHELDLYIAGEAQDLDLTIPPDLHPVDALEKYIIRELRTRKPQLVQRRGGDGVRLVRTGMSDDVVLADIAAAIENNALTMGELEAVVREQLRGR
jgi:hypothetical protein